MIGDFRFWILDFGLRDNKRLLFVVILALIIGFPSAVFSQSGGGFNLEYAVIAGGGGKSSGGGFTLEGTSGQNNAGTDVAGGNFTLEDGFWSFEQLAPTAAFVNVGGRVTTPKNQGIERILVTITDTATNLTFQTYTNSFGYYRFADIPVGQIYVITVSHRKYRFAANSQVVNLDNERNDIDFVGSENE